MIFQFLIIFSLVAIFVILVRKFPQTGENSFGFKLPKFIFKFPALPRIPRIPGLPKVNLPIGNKHKPEIHEEDPLSQADYAFANHDFAFAEEMYVQAASLRPKDAKIYARLGVIYLQQKNYKDARDALLTSLRLNDKVSSRHYNLALAYQGMDTPKKALTEVKRAIELDPTNEKYETLKQKLEG